jgi:plasmid stabilization system protein ParE
VKSLRTHTLYWCEFADAVNYYKKIDVALAERFAAATQKTIEKIAQFPMLGRKIVNKDKEYRSIFVPGFPFRLNYIVEENGDLLVLYIVHLRREPSSFKI